VRVAPLLVLALVFEALPAAADTNACLESHAEGQRAERRGELLRARARYAQCTAVECPDAVRRDCDDFRAKVDAAVPTLILRPRDPSRGDVEASIRVDEASVPREKAGVPIEVDPGPRRIRVDATGYKPYDQTIVVVAGEKSRVVEVQLVPNAPVQTAVAPPEAKPSPWPYVLGVVGVVGVGSFLGIGLSAQSRYDELLGSCSPRCNPDDVDGIKRSYVIADVALVIGGTALVAATAWLVVRAMSSGRASSWAVPSVVSF
jgi:hypothetical protein